MFLIQRLLAPYLRPLDLLIFAMVVDLWIPARNDSSASVRIRVFPHVVSFPTYLRLQGIVNNVTSITLPQALVSKLRCREELDKDGSDLTIESEVPPYTSALFREPGKGSRPCRHHPRGRLLSGCSCRDTELFPPREACVPNVPNAHPTSSSH